MSCLRPLRPQRGASGGTVRLRASPVTNPRHGGAPRHDRGCPVRPHASAHCRWAPVCRSRCFHRDRPPCALGSASGGGCQPAGDNSSAPSGLRPACCPQTLSRWRLSCLCPAQNQAGFPRNAVKARRVLLAGGSGFLGRVLRTHFLKQGCEVIVLTRSPRGSDSSGRECFWDGRTLGEWARELDGADVLINLAGRTVNCRYNEQNRREILESRIDSTRVLGTAIAHCATPPRLWLNSSTATIYEHTFGPAWDESGRIAHTRAVNDEFSVEVAQAWEHALESASTPRTRKVALRTAMVLGHGANSVFPTLRRLVRCGLGGRMGDGRQFVSWIHEHDLCRALDFIGDHAEISGPVNLSAPEPLTNREMMESLRRLCHIPTGLPATRWMLGLGAIVLRTETELILKSRRVIPGRLVNAGFQFQFSRFEDAARHLLNGVVSREKIQ